MPSCARAQNSTVIEQEMYTGGSELLPVGGPSRAPDTLVFKRDRTGGGPDGCSEGGNSARGASPGEKGGTSCPVGGNRRHHVSVC
jgi:hypothetical protein